MNSKKILLSGISALMSVSMLAGCSSSTDDSAATAGTDSEEEITATITVWTPSEDQSEDSGNWLQKELDAFQEEHPNWHLTFETGVCAEGDAGSTVSSDAEAAADVYMYANDQIGTLLDAGALSKLGGSTLEQVQSQNSEAVVNTATYNGSVYGVPFTGNTWYLYYNASKVTEEQAKTLEGLMEAGTVSFPISNSWYIASFYAADGATFFGADGQDENAGIVFGDNATDVTKYIVEAVKSGNLVDDRDGSGLAGLGDGSIVAMFSGSWDYQNVVEALGGEDNVGVAALPTITVDGTEMQLKSFAGSKLIGVNPNTEYPEVAVALAAYLGSTQAQQDHYDLRNIIPTDTSIDVGDDKLAAAQMDTMDRTSILQPSWSGMNNWWTPAETFGKNIVNGSVTVDNAEEMTTQFEESANSSAVE